LSLSTAASRDVRAYQIIHHNRRCIARTEKCSHESAPIDSRGKPVLASCDETRSWCARKFFCCQKSRLRVRARCFRATPMGRNNGDEMPIVDSVNHRNHCGTVTSCNILNCPLRFVAQFSLRRADGLVCRRSPRVARSHPSRQHFLKRDAVFFNVLVYSGCSAFRFPSARSD